MICWLPDLPDLRDKFLVIKVLKLNSLLVHEFIGRIGLLVLLVYWLRPVATRGNHEYVGLREPEAAAPPETFSGGAEAAAPPDQAPADQGLTNGGLRKNPGKSQKNH